MGGEIIGRTAKTMREVRSRRRGAEAKAIRIEQIR
jgi:hypothetical protein